MEAGPNRDSSAPHARPASARGLRLRPSPVWIAVFALAWWVVAGDLGSEPLPAALAVGVAGLLHAVLGGRRGPRLSCRGALRFAPYFLRAALVGGLDVARRALSPTMPLDPGLWRYSIRLPDGPPRVLFVNCLSLLPGTFSADLEGSELTVHLLARDASGPGRLRELEERVAGLFGLALDAGGDGP